MRRIKAMPNCRHCGSFQSGVSPTPYCGAQNRPLEDKDGFPEFCKLPTVQDFIMKEILPKVLICSDCGSELGFCWGEEEEGFLIFDCPNKECEIATVAISKKMIDKLTEVE